MWNDHGLSCLVLLAFLPLLRFKREALRERAERQAEIERDRAEETPELIPVSPIVRAHPARRRTDKEMAA